MRDILKQSVSDHGSGVDAINDRSSYSLVEAAVQLGVSWSTLRRWIRAGRLAVGGVGQHTIRTTRDELKRFRLREAAGRSAGIVWAQGAASAARAATHAASQPVMRPEPRELGVPEHSVQFYDSDTYLLNTVEEFISAALRAGETGIVFATPSHRADLEARLQARGLDAAAAGASGRYLALDAAETLATFMVEGVPEPERFTRTVGGIVARASEGGRPVHVFGEMVTLLATEGNPSGAVRLEKLWNSLQQTQPCTILCAYPMDRLGGEAFAEVFSDVCAAHTRVIPSESYTSLPTVHDRSRAVTLLQQKACWLEDEIVQRKRAEEQLLVALTAEQAARQEAEAALRLRDEFLAIAAHELKTPLTSLSGYAQLVRRQLMRDGHLEPARLDQALAVITGQADRLSRLLNQLLDISRLEDGKLAPDRQSTDLVALAEQVVADGRARSEWHRITLTAPASMQAHVDPLRLEQVLSNLVDNAIKYSPGGGAIDVVLSQPRPAMVALSVRDHGPGIPPEKRDQIFERFSQAHGDVHASGLGLGLYISRQIVELHGGEINVEFPADGGTRFTVHLPTGLPRPRRPGLAPE